MVSTTATTTLSFSKMHGAANDFVVIDMRNLESPTPALCRALADRHRGVGCDLILGIRNPRTLDAVASFEIWTADGVPAQQCGNGARCVAAWLLRAGIARGPRFTIDSPRRTHIVEVLSADSLCVDMGEPGFGPEQVPVQGFDREQELYEVDLGSGAPVRFAAVSMGNPHVVIEVDNIDRAPVANVGLALQKSGVLPPDVNVGFAEVLSRDRIRLRVYEYGAGETLACGSGACAAVATLVRRGRVGSRVTVELRGGELEVSWSATGQILLSGPVAFAYEGRFSDASL